MAELQLLTELLALLESHPTAISGRSRGTQTLPDPAPKVNHPPVLPRAAGTCVSILVEIYLKLWGGGEGRGQGCYFWTAGRPLNICCQICRGSDFLPSSVGAIFL